MTLGGAAQVAAPHCPNERTLDPAVCSYNRPTYAPASRSMAFAPLYRVAFSDSQLLSVNQSLGRLQCSIGKCGTIKNAEVENAGLESARPEKVWSITSVLAHA